MGRSQSTPLVIGEDCAGLFTTSYVLDALGVHANIAFASEKDSALSAHCRPELCDNSLMYDDMLKRSPAPPAVHLYTCGFPCQKESTQGTRVFSNRCCHASAKYICTYQPLSFALENVVGFLRGNQRKQRFHRLLQKLRRCYNVKYEIVSPDECCAIPHRRPRVIIVGVRKGTPACTKFDVEWRWPDPVFCPTLDGFLKHGSPSLRRPSITQNPKCTSKRNLEKMLGQFKDGSLDKNKPVLIDLASSDGWEQVSDGTCPCVTKARASSSAFWMIYLQQTQQWLIDGLTPPMYRLTVDDYAKLQGFPLSVMSKYGGVKPASLRGALGNAINFELLKLVIRQLVEMMRAD